MMPDKYVMGQGERPRGPGRGKSLALMFATLNGTVKSVPSLEVSLTLFSDMMESLPCSRPEADRATGSDKASFVSEQTRAGQRAGAGRENGGGGEKRAKGAKHT